MQISEINRNLPVLDSGMFIKHNLAPWSEPPEYVFEAAPIWHDNPDMVVDEQAQIYLRNILQKSRKAVDTLKGEVDRRGREIGQLSKRWDELKYDENEAQKETDVARVGSAASFQYEYADPE